MFLFSQNVVLIIKKTNLYFFSKIEKFYFFPKNFKNIEKMVKNFDKFFKCFFFLISFLKKINKSDNKKFFTKCSLKKLVFTEFIFTLSIYLVVFRKNDLVHVVNSLIVFVFFLFKKVKK